MTPLPAFSEQVVERRDLPGYEIPNRCCNPRCPNRAEHPHEIRPRSQTAGMVWWVEIPGRFMLGNRVGVCAGCHRMTDDHTVAIIWDDQVEEFAWCNLAESDQWAEALNPMPPIHRIVETGVIGPEGQKERQPEPVPIEPQDVEGMEQLGPAMQNMERFLAGGELPPPERPSSELLEAAQHDDSIAEDLGIQPIELPPEPEQPAFTLPQDAPIDPTEPMPGSDETTVAAARAATEGAQQRAVDVTGLGEFQPGVAPWRADIIVHPDENRVEVLTGDLRVGTFLEETIEKAKRAPKPRAPKPEIPDDGEREPAKARRTWSLSVPANERDGEKVAAGEDGYQLIEEALENLRQRFGDDDHPGWRYYVLMKALAWMLLNYTDEGED